LTNDNDRKLDDSAAAAKEEEEAYDIEGPESVEEEDLKWFW
jgi:hypothetical protein